MVSLKSPLRKLLEVGIIAVALFYIARLLHAYCVSDSVSFPVATAVFALFAAMAVHSVHFLVTKHTSLRDMAKKPTRKDSLLGSSCGFLLGAAALLLCLFATDVPTVKRVFLFLGFFFFGWGALGYMRRARRQSSSGRDTRADGPGAHEGGQEG